MDLILANPLIAILVIIIIAVVGKYLFVSKESEKELEKEFNKDIHDLELKITEKFGLCSEKMRIIQKEISDEVDNKYFTKEMAEKHNERITKMEEVIKEVLPRMEKLDIMYNIVTQNRENK